MLILVVLLTAWRYAMVTD